MDPDETLTSLLSLCKNIHHTKDWFWQTPPGIFHRLPHLQPGAKPALTSAGKRENRPTKTRENFATFKLAKDSTSWEVQRHLMTSHLIHLLGGLSSPAIIDFGRKQWCCLPAGYYFNIVLGTELKHTRNELDPTSHHQQALSCPRLWRQWHTQGTQCSLPPLINLRKGRKGKGELSHGPQLLITSRESIQTVQGT